MRDAGSKHLPMFVLVVEDDGDIRSLVGLILLGEGYEVATASNGKDALEFLRARRHVDLVVTDLMMPGLDGWALIEILRSHPAFARTPVLAMTGVVTAARLPADVPVLKKPFALNALLEAVASASPGATIAPGLRDETQLLGAASGLVRRPLATPTESS